MQNAEMVGRRARERTQTAVAKAVGLGQSYYSMIEKRQAPAQQAHRHTDRPRVGRGLAEIF